ncbi:MAG: HAMP domain-containing histidine kinase [Bacteroidales bacterium]|nr:HAMP domain-containing histidine kinase [Bacteroidales bacterium]
MDSILTHRLDSLGYPLEHRIVLMDGEEILAEAQTPAYTSSSRDEHISMTSIANCGAGYELYCEPMTGSVLRGMMGVLMMSAGILLILALVFYLMVRALRKQRELDEMKSDFTSNMTHELKTPIAVAYAANDAMLVYGLDKNPEKREEYLKVTRESLEKLNGMVEQILSMSMENRDRLSLRIESTELKPLLESVAAQTRLSAGKPCQIAVSVIPEGLTADIDASLMSSVIATLLDNAVKYSGDSADIHLSAEEKDGHVRILVRDKGIGIAPEKQAHIFEKFYRVPTGDVHDVKGYGIGLFFAKTIVEKHGGHISVDSEPGKGSTFTIEL